MGNSRSVLLTFLNVGRTCTQLWVHVIRASIDFSIGKRVFITINDSIFQRIFDR